jgi:sensor histidine kinase regulating citrate/malate metabolism
VQTSLLVLLMVVALLVVGLEGRHDAQSRDRDLVLGVARTLASSPFVLSAVTTTDPATRLRPYTEAVRRANDVDFVVIMAPDRTRWTHPDPRRVGKQFAGRIQPALDGETFSEISGAPGRTVQAVSPVVDGDGDVVALVAVGTGTGSWANEVVRLLPMLLLLLLAGVAAAYAGGPLERQMERQRSARATASRARDTDA